MFIEYMRDANGHWQVCKVGTCDVETDHWKDCAVVGCGVVIDGSKAPHSSSGANVATCKHKASCDVCGAEYGELAAHNWLPATSIAPKTDADCGAIIEASKAAHTPDRDAATETEPVKCSTCGYIITPAIGHKHDADNSKFSSDETEHWNEYSGCSEKQNKAPHDFKWVTDKQASETETGLKHEECTVRGYEKAAVEIPKIDPTDPNPTEPVAPKPTEPVDPSDPSDENDPAEPLAKPENPDIPKTGDDSMLGFRIAVLTAGGAAVTTVCIRRSKSSA